jgi:hypothetical protein
MSAYRAAGERSEGRATEIEIFRLASKKRLHLFVIAAGFLFVSIVGGVVVYVRHTPSLTGALACGMLCAATFAFSGFRSFGLLVVSHVPSERTLRIRIEAWKSSERTVTFHHRPKVRVEEVHHRVSNRDAPDVPPSCRVRVDGSPRGFTIERPLPRAAARRLQIALDEATSSWPEH